jgi:DNA-binding CsgD family transcriptional regulator
MKGEMRPLAADTGIAEASSARLLPVVLDLFRATLQSDALRLMLQAVAPLFGTEKAMFVHVDRTHPRESFTKVIGLPVEYERALQGRDLKADPLWPVLLCQPAGRTFLTTELIPGPELHASALYEAIALPAGIEYGVGAVLENEPQAFSVIGVLRSGTDFGERDRATMAELVGCLQLAQRTARRIAVGDAGRREALLGFDRARQPMVVLDRSGYAIYRNESAALALANAPGLQLKLGRFIFDGVAEQAEFERAVRVAVARAEDTDGWPAPVDIRIARKGAGAPLVLSVVSLGRPADRALMPDGAGCMVLIHDYEGMVPLPVERLVWLYRLTRAEARICESLYRVGTVDGVALEISLTQHTVRSHLKSIYSKLGVTTQAQLMQRLANAAQRWLDDGVSSLSS